MSAAHRPRARQPTLQDVADSATGVALAVRLLVELGHQRIAHPAARRT